MSRVGVDAQIVAILAVHNRCASTMRALAALATGASLSQTTLHAIVVNDGSTDETTQCLLTFDGLKISIIDGDGTWYWAQSMARAEAEALAALTSSDPSWILWLNDDVDLDDDAIERLLEIAATHPHRIIVGSTRDNASGAVTYGGLDRRGVHPLAYALVDPPSDEPRAVDSFNGNIVLVPVDVALVIGGIDGGYAHGLADIDYGWRACEAGTPALLAPGTFGTCERNPPPPRESTLKRWRRFISIKGGGHPASMRRFLRKVRPRTWPLWWLSTYAKWWLLWPLRALRASR